MDDRAGGSATEAKKGILKTAAKRRENGQKRLYKQQASEADDGTRTHDLLHGKQTL